MHRLDQKPVVWNYLRLLMQRAAIYSVQGVAVTAPPPAPAPSPSARPRVNVYLCIKQALFIRPMNMHCLVAVARCRVQTRRYHCLINHIQSHRLTLCRTPPPRCPLFAVLYPLFPVLRSRHPSRGEDPPCHPAELSPSRVLPRRVISLAPLLASASAVHSPAAPLSPTGRN